MPTNDEIKKNHWIGNAPSGFGKITTEAQIDSMLNSARQDEREKMKENRIVSNAIILEGKPIPKRKWEKYIELKARSDTLEKVKKMIEAEQKHNENIKDVSLDGGYFVKKRLLAVLLSQLETLKGE